jgi:PIN domain nuclease of toxin-antitoxin system
MLLLDTCALIWIIRGEVIKRSALTAVRRASSRGELFASPISAWEVGMLVRRGRLGLSITAARFVSIAFAMPGLGVAPLTPEMAVASSSLPGLFGDDPADRMLIATAMEIGARIVTRDRAIIEYGKLGHVGVLEC